jgi:hypothetical protein
LTNLEKIELPKEYYELQALNLQHEKLEASYGEIFPKVCSNLVHDLILRLRQDPQDQPLYTVEVFTKEGTDSQACKDHIFATTGNVPGIYDQGTHYVTHMRLTLEILKRLNDFEFVLEVMGEYTETAASLGPLHDIGEAKIDRIKSEDVRERIPTEKRTHDDAPEKISTKKRKSKTSRTLIYTLVGLFIAITLSAFVVSGGLLPNVNKNATPASSIQISHLSSISGRVTGPLGLPALGTSVIAHKIQELPGTEQVLPDYTINSIISVDGKYSFNLPAGVYRITVAFPDGTNHIVNTYAIWPGSAHTLDFKY